MVGPGCAGRPAQQVSGGALAAQCAGGRGHSGLGRVRARHERRAVRHCRGTCILRLTGHAESIRAAVHDSGPRLPRIRTPDLYGGTGGFGWPTVSRRLAPEAMWRQKASEALTDSARPGEFSVISIEPSPT